MSAAPQKIFRIRREYNAWVANETLEDYALRYTPRSARKWSEWQVANTAFGGIAFLALEAIGAAIALNYGFTNALWAILAMALIIFLTALPIAVYAARHGLDMDLLTRGAGFGYLGSTITSLVYASFTFIFFAVEAAIMALALQMALGWPLLVSYLVSALVIVPMVLHGITFISRLQAWTQPVWALLLIAPFLWFALVQPQLYGDFTGMAGLRSGSAGFDALMFGAASMVIFALVVQIGEQVDYLRFMPRRTQANRVRWWAAVLVGGPGWIVLGAMRMLGGAFLAYVALHVGGATAAQAGEPTHMYLAAFTRMLGDTWVALGVVLVFVVLSQVKINVTNAYAGSLAWSNVFARLTRSHPGRVVWLVFNVLIATLLMTLGVFGALEKVLGFYSNLAAAWIGALVADLVVNKPLGLSPRSVEFRRAYLYDLNPVGLGALASAVLLAGVAYLGWLGPWAAAFSPFIALATAFVAAPLLAWVTRGRYYLARSDPAPWPPGAMVTCAVCENSFESADMAPCPAYGAPICSLCCSLESRCHDRCKHVPARAGEQLRHAVGAVLPVSWARRFNFRVANYFTVLLALCAVVAFLMGVVYMQQSLSVAPELLMQPFLQVFSLMVLLAALCAWWVVLAGESRRMAQDESERQTQLLQKEADAHKRTDAALQAAKEQADSANQAKTRYVAGMAHELRTPLNSILGYTQILLRGDELADPVRRAVKTMQHSGQHMHELIDGLLDLARIEAGRLRLDMAPLRFPAFLDELARMVRPQAEAKGLAFALHTRGRVPPWVRADARRLRQILINLLGNAVRFTDKGSVTLRVACLSDVVRFEVQDTGIGIAAQDQERIFMPFERGSAGRRASEAGTGLGLAITQMLTVLMGGELCVRSAIGAGSTFTARLYLREIAPPEAEVEQAGRLTRPVTGYAGKRRTLLVVDDQPLQRQLLAGLLIPLGFDVKEAASGHECLEIVQDAPPDAVLLDLSMDDLSGWQTAALLRERWDAAKLPIVIVSADLFENQPERVAAAGCQGFVGKPIIESELLDLLARALALRWQHESDAPSAVQPPEPRADVPPLPRELRQNLMQLARFGNAGGVRALMQSATLHEPGLAPAMQALAVHVERFDFTAFVRDLRESSDDD